MTAEPRRLFDLDPERLELLRRRRRAEGLAADGGGGAAVAANDPIPRLAAGARRLPSFAQERLWFLDRLAPGTPDLVIPVAIRLTGPLDRGALAAALAGVVARHDALRSRFEERDGRPVVEVAPPAPAPLPVVDLAALPGDRRRPESVRLADRFARHRFRLDAAPLLVARLIRSDDGGPGGGSSGDEHVLSVAVHHVAADGWSLGILFRELTALYTAARSHRPARLPGLATGYTDWAAWQRERLSGERLAAETAWWRERLAGAPRQLDLPTDRPRPAVQAFAGRSLRRDLPADLADRLRAVGRAAPGGEASPFMVLLAGLAVLLGRWSGAREVVVGAPVAGRTRRELEGVVGLFLNHLVLRIDLSGDPSFAELVARVRDAALGAFAHQELPFERLLDALTPERDLSRTPLFQVFFNLMSFPVPEIELPGVAAEAVAPPRAPAKFDLTVYADDRGPGGPVRVEIVWDGALFDRERMVLAAEQYAHLLAHAGAEPGAPIAGLSLIPPGSRAVIPDPAAALDDGWPGPVHRAVDRHADDDPERIALADPQGVTTYGELAAASARLAARLAGLGVRRGDTVAVLAHRSAALAATLLGIHRAGAAFVVLDPAHPETRNAACLAACRPRALVVMHGAGPAPGIAGNLPVLELPPLPGGPGGWLDDAAGSPSPEIARPPEITLTPDDLAYVAFTSGSTGAPKGVLGRHRSLTHFQGWMAERFALGAGDRFSVLSGLAHDPLHRDLLTPLWLGARAVFPDPDRFGEPGYLARWMAETGVTVSHLTPATSRLLATAADTGGGPRLPGLRRAFFLGEALRRTDVERLSALAPAVLAANLYGTTETQRAVGFHVVEADAGGHAVVPLGRGMADVQLLVTGPRGELAGVGEVGEILVRSPHLAGGYLGDPRLTAERFVPSGGAPAGGRAYRTGDLGRYRPDGAVEPLGRRDRQVQVRGFRVEPAEIEAALVSLPGVAEAAVVPRGAGPDGPRLVAYVVGAGGRAPDPAALRAGLAATLPAHLVPADWVPLAALPRTANRKVDLAALPEPSPPAEQGAPPATPAEELLAGIWREVLELDAVARDDDFFALGGHSLAVTRVLARVRDAFGVDLPVRAAFEATRLSAQAAAIEAAARGGAGPPLPPPEPLPRDHPLPLSFGQERLWFLDRFAPRSAAYTLSAALELAGRLDEGALAAALSALVARHEPLRTAFPAPGGRPVQRIAPPRPVPLPRLDLASLPGERSAAEASRIAGREARHRFDLSAGPPFAALLARLGGDRWLLSLALHHAVGDAWSLAVLARDLGALYRAAVGGGEAGLPPLRIQYADWAGWQRQALAGDALAEHLAAWRLRLAGAPEALALPTDRPRPSVQDFRGARVVRALPPALSERLDGLGREVGATGFMVVLAALAAVLGRWSGQDDVVVGSPIAGRDRPETEPLVGLFLDLVPLRMSLAGEPSFRQLLARAREVVLEAFAHRDVPFERILAEVGAPRDPARHPLFDVLLNALTTPAPRLDLPDLEVRVREPVEREAKLALTVYVVRGEEGLHLSALYQRALFDRERMDELLAQLEALLAAAAAEPDRPLGELALSTAASRRLPTDPAAPLAVYPGPSVPERFLALAREDADRPAVARAGRSWTYGELAAAVERAARAVRAAGAGPGDVVAVEGAGSFGWVAALLGVLRLGSVLLLVDPELPAARRRQMVAAARAVLVVRGAGRPGGEEGEPDDRPVLDLDPEEGLRPPDGTDGADGTGAPADLPPPPGDGPAYAVFTSGTTGEPKAVLGAHRGLAAFLAWEREALGIGPGDRVAQLTSPSFDVVFRDLLLPLTSGATLVLPDDPGPARLEPERVLRWLDREAITVLHAVPAVVHAWLAAAPPDGVRLGALRWLLFAGEPLPGALVERFRQTFPDAPAAGRGGEGGRDAGIGNLYGPTETTLAQCFHRVPVPAASGVQPIGRPLPGAQALVWAFPPGGGRPRPCAPGEAGEIVLRTPHRSLGYLTSPEADRARFFRNPFADAVAEDRDDLVYRTGDLGRLRLDGALDILGRADDQLKVRGVRVEPGEVVAALELHPAVAAAAVAPWREGGGVELAAWVVARTGRAPGRRELAAWLARRLPAPAVPTRWAFLDRLPLSPNGKVDRTALPSPQPAAVARRGPGAPPRDALEREVVAAFEAVLGVSEVGLDDGFFELGGHSLLAVSLAARLEARLGRRLPLAALFERPTPGGIAELLRRAGGPRRSSPLVGIRRGGGRPPLVLVHPGGGGVLCYADLARELGPDQPLWALQSIGLDGGEPPLDRIEDMAERYLAAVRHQLPAGPYHLGGWSFGGRVAFEMARRLRQAGEEVGLVAILDVGPDPSPAPFGAADDDSALVARALGDLFPGLAAELRGLGEGEVLDQVLARAKAEGRVPDDLSRDRAEAVYRVFRANMAAARSFRQRPYPGPVTLFRAADSDRLDPAQPAGGWDRLAAGGVEVVTVPGDHHSMVAPPHVATLAAELAGLLDRALTTGRQALVT